ncbi:MAG: hypothetical protein DLM62_05600, partial [Pseudonocardiales bacterium]
AVTDHQQSTKINSLATAPLNGTPEWTRADLAGMYGPYQIPQYARSTDHGVRIFFTMSTWNPYQVMLMTLDISTPLQ